MATILQYKKVIYECSCGKWKILPELFFCRQCFKLKCDDCACKEIDTLFCPRCLEVSSAPEARLKKNQCGNCNDCPLCANLLSARVENEQAYLICQFCHWSTRDAGVEDRKNAKAWPVHENAISDHLNEVMAYMRKLEMIENAPKDLKNRKSNKSWSALHLKDKFGMQQMVANRRKLLAPELKPIESIKPSDPLTLEEELELRNQNQDFRKLDEIIMQPLAAVHDPLLPVKVSLQGRTLIRCNECDRTLVKRDYGVATHKFKINTFAREYVPDIRLSRPVEWEESGQIAHVLLSLTNLSLSKLDMNITPETNNENLVQCSTQPIDISVPSTKDSDQGFTGVPAENSEVIVFRQHNRIGLRLDVTHALNGPNVLGLNIVYTQNGAFGLLAASEKAQMAEESKSDKPLVANVRIALD